MALQDLKTSVTTHGRVSHDGTDNDVIWGHSEAMDVVRRSLRRVAPTTVSVMIIGESGTGKEVIARAVHALSSRADGPLFTINCGAMSPNLVESELFGHEKGSFTGAERQHTGVFERASGGTLLLDEVTEMSADLQVKLLRVLESKQVQRVGGSHPVRTDVRLISATNRIPFDAVAEGRLREDLMYRLDVFPIILPTLRERLEDVPALAQHFLATLAEREGRSARFTAEALSTLQRYDWPGNVRQLRNIVQRAYVMAHNAWLNSDDVRSVMPGARSLRIDSRLETRLEPGIREVQRPPWHIERLTTDEASGAPAISWPATDSPAGPAGRSGAPDRSPARHRATIELRVGMSLADAQRELILSTLEYCGRNRERTAAVLGISLKTLYNRMKEYGRRTDGFVAEVPATERQAPPVALHVDGDDATLVRSVTQF